MHHIDWAAIGGICALVTLLGVIAGFLWNKVGKELIIGGLQLVRDFNGRPERLDGSGQKIEDAQPGMMVRMNTVEHLAATAAKLAAESHSGYAELRLSMEDIRAQLSPNSGKTVYDQAKRAADAAEQAVAAVAGSSNPTVSVHVDTKAAS